MDTVLEHFLRNGGHHPVLVDVGASGASPGLWQPLAKHAVRVAFDPDLREMKQENDGQWYRSTILNEAITPDPNSSEVRFNLTRSPYCSSTLVPDAALVSNFFEAERFDVQQQTTARAATLDSVLKRLSLDHIDWLKLDTQGTDLRIYNSISPEVRATMLAVDLEPGLRGAYVGEDLFGDVHRDLRRDGFWLSNLRLDGFVRMRSSTLDAVRVAAPDLTRSEIEKAVRKVPGWVEVRYLRSLEWMASRRANERDYQLLWLFAMLDAQFGFALDVSMQYEKTFGVDSASAVMSTEPVERIRSTRAAQRQKEYVSPARRVYRRLRGLAKSALRAVTPAQPNRA
jgi:FkbM family methyltransferase